MECTQSLNWRLWLLIGEGGCWKNELLSISKWQHRHLDCVGLDTAPMKLGSSVFYPETVWFQTFILHKKLKTWFPNQPFVFFFFLSLPHIFSHCFSHMHARLCFIFIKKTTEKVNFFLHRELNENKPSLLSVLYPWNFANNNVGFICCVGLKMLSQCQTTYQAAGLQMFWIFQLFILSFLVSQRLMRTSSSNEK